MFINFVCYLALSKFIYLFFFLVFFIIQFLFFLNDLNMFNISFKEIIIRSLHLILIYFNLHRLLLSLNLKMIISLIFHFQIFYNYLILPFIILYYTSNNYFSNSSYNIEFSFVSIWLSAYATCFFKFVIISFSYYHIFILLLIITIIQIFFLYFHFLCFL